MGRCVQDTQTGTRTWGHVSQAETQPWTDSDQPWLAFHTQNCAPQLGSRGS